MYHLECQACGFEQYSASYDPSDTCVRCGVQALRIVTEPEGMAEEDKEEGGDG